jgi:hypothetical protein
LQYGDPQHITCEGDSGGPCLLSVGGVETIIGITSFGDQACQNVSFGSLMDDYADSFVIPYIHQFDGMVAPVADMAMSSPPDMASRNGANQGTGDMAASSSHGGSGCSLRGASEANGRAPLLLGLALIVSLLRRRARQRRWPG